MRGDPVVPVQISALSRELIFYKSRLDGLVRSVEIIGRTRSKGRAGKGRNVVGLRAGRQDDGRAGTFC